MKLCFYVCYRVNLFYSVAPSNQYQSSSNLITLTPGAAPTAVESAGHDQIMVEFTNLRDHMINQAKTTADDVNRNMDEELKVFRNDINEKLKLLGVNKAILKELEKSFKNEANKNDSSRNEQKVYLKNISGWFSKFLRSNNMRNPFYMSHIQLPILIRDENQTKTK